MDNFDQAEVQENYDTSEDVRNLGAYDLFAFLGKKVINPGGIKGRDLLLESVEIKPGDKLLEVGCGTGHAACHIADQFKCDVTAVDVSEEMIETARKVVREEKMQDCVHVQMADTENLPFEDNTFDVVVAQAVLMFVNPTNALAELFRVLKPGGRFAALEFCWKRSPDDCLKTDTYDVCGCQGLDFHHHVDWCDMITRAGFKNARSVPHPFDVLSIKGFIRDEGVVNALKVAGKIFSGKAQLRRTWEIWQHFSKNLEYYEYTILSAEKAIH